MVSSSLILLLSKFNISIGIPFVGVLCIGLILTQEDMGWVPPYIVSGDLVCIFMAHALYFFYGIKLLKESMYTD
jgi:hypothetical protein